MVVYATFTYRDNMVNFKADIVQRRHHFAIVDEVDSILIDEARTPLIISGPAEESTDKYYRANEIAKQMSGKKIVDEEKAPDNYVNEKNLSYLDKAMLIEIFRKIESFQGKLKTDFMGMV